MASYKTFVAGIIFLTVISGAAFSQDELKIERWATGTMELQDKSGRKFKATFKYPVFKETGDKSPGSGCRRFCEQVCSEFACRNVCIWNCLTR